MGPGMVIDPMAPSACQVGPRPVVSFPIPALSHQPGGGVILAIPSDSLSSSQWRGARGCNLRLRFGLGGCGVGIMGVVRGLVWDRVVIFGGGCFVNLLIGLMRGAGCDCVSVIFGGCCFASSLIRLSKGSGCDCNWHCG